jgi:Fe2+ transport system protein FeoA
MEKIMAKQIAVQDDVVEIIEKLAKHDKVPATEAADRLLRMGISRHNALAKYAKSQAGEPVAKPKGKNKAKKAAKKAKQAEA